MCYKNKAGAYCDLLRLGLLLKLTLGLLVGSLRLLIRGLGLLIRGLGLLIGGLRLGI